MHEIAEKMTLGETVEPDAEALPYVENVNKILAELKAKGYSPIESEINIKIPLAQIIPTEDSILFNGKIDAIFKKNDEYLIVDWKTSKKDDDSAEYRQQLEIYKRVYSIHAKVPVEKIKVAIAYIGLRKTINDGKIEYNLDDKQPAKTSFDTMQKKLQKFLEWKEDVNKFFSDLMEEETDDVLWRSVVEQYGKER